MGVVFQLREIIGLEEVIFGEVRQNFSSALEDFLVLLLDELIQKIFYLPQRHGLFSLFFLKKPLIRAAHSSCNTPLLTSRLWIGCRFSRTSIQLPWAPWRRSGAPQTTFFMR